MAMAKPAVVANRGMLPEIIEDGNDGYVFDGSAEGLYRALRMFAKSRPHTHRMGQAAREKAVKDYSLDAQARAVLGVYEKVLAERKA